MSSYRGRPAPSFEELLDYRPAGALLAGRVVLITGAAAGIGRAVAVACARQGADTVLLDCNARRLEEVRGAIVAEGHRDPELVLADLAVATISDYRRVAESLGERFGRLDGMVNNAGWIGALAPFEHVEPETWGRAITINLLAPFFLTQWCMPLLRKSADPALVFSLHEASRAFWGGYGVAKAGLAGLLRIIADEYHPRSAHPVRVLGIDPGPVMTAERRKHYPGEHPEAHPQPESVVGPYLFALGPEGAGLSGLVFAPAGRSEPRVTPHVP